MSTSRTRLFVVAFATVTMLAVIPATAWGQLTVTDDTYVSGAAPTTANGSVGSLVVQGSTTGKPSYSYIRFDLTSLGAVSSSQVQKATLRLYVSAVTVAGGFDIIEVASPTGWVEGTLIYNTSGASSPAGTMLNVSPISVPYPSGKYQYILVDVTPAVQHWLNGTQNNGLVLKPHDSSISVAFASKEDTTYSHDPVLNVQLLSSSITGSITEAQVVGLTTDLGNLNVNVASRVPLSAVGAMNGVAALDGTARVPTTELPNTLVYNNQSNTFGAGLKQIFQSNSMAGLNFAAAPSNANPGSLTAGDVWFRLDLKHLHFFDGSLTHQLMLRDDTIPGSQVVGNIAGSAGSIVGNIPESQVTNLTVDLGALTTSLSSETSARQTADTTLQNNINSEAATRVAADSAEATARMAADVAEASARVTADTALQSSINTEAARATAAENGKASLAGDNIFAGSNMFTGLKVDLSGAGATLPVQSILGPPHTGPGVCMAGQMVLQKDAPAGKQLFICNTALNGWVMVNDDAATTQAANTYTDSAVATEATARIAADNAEMAARQAADTTLQSNIDAEAATRSAAETAEAAARQAAVQGEAIARMAADATLQSNIGAETTRAMGAEGALTTSINNEVTRAQAAEATKADLVKPVQLDNTAIVNGSCTAVNALVLNPNQPSGQQLFICRDVSNVLHWELINDDAATTSTANAYTDSAVAAEATARAAADTTLQNNINAESAARALAGAAEASVRAAADTTLQSNIDAETARATTAEATKASLAADNTFGGVNTFTNKVDMTAAKTLPVQTTLMTPPATGFPNSCVAGQMLLQVNGMAGQQLFICNSNLDGWVMVNDDTATASAANAYTDSAVAAEATARAAADTTLQSNINAETAARQTADTTLQNNINSETAARIAADAAEGAARMAADVAEASARMTEDTTLQSNITAETARATAAEATKPNLGGDNTFSGGNTFTGPKVDLSGAGATLPFQTTNVAPPAMGQPNACVDGQILLYLGGAPGQQLYICKSPSHDGWALLDDESAVTTSITAETNRATAAENTLTSNLNTEISRAQGAESTITNNLNSEISRAQGAETTLQTNINNEAGARMAADAILGNSIAAETTRATGAETGLQNNFNALDAASAKLASPNTFTAANTFTGAKVDLSNSSATLPVQTIMGPPLTGTNVCMPGQMVLQKDGLPGQQLFICNATFDGWVAVNDDAATTSAANAYTDSKVAVEATARATADSAEAAARAQSDAETLSSANTFTTNAVAAEAATRAAGDTAAVTSANSFTSAVVASEATARLQGDVDTLTASKTYTDNGLALKANLAGGNSLSGDQSVTGNETVNGTLNLPAVQTNANTPSASHILNLSGWDGTNPTIFQWLVNNNGKLDLFTGAAGNSPVSSGLMIGPDGKITFASGQTFPGTQNLTAGTGIGFVGDAITNTGVLSFNGRNGAVSAVSGDYSFSQISGTITSGQVSAGTYGIDITGNAATATSAGTAALAANATNAANSALLSGEAPATAATASTIAARDASGDLFANVFHGSGASLTNIPISALPGNVAYTDAANIFSQTQTLGPLSNAASQPSNLFRLKALDGSSTSQSAQLQAKADGSLSFQFGPTAGPIAEKLSIDNAGLITFAPGQTFPGTNNGTVTQVNTGAGLTGGPISTTGTISIASGGVTNAMLQNSSIGVVAGTGIGVSGTSSLGGSFTIANTGVLSFNGRNGLVTSQANDYSFAQLSGTDSPTSNLVYNNQANTYTAGSKQTFKASAALAGLSFDSGTANDPTTLATGDTWFNTTASHLKFFDGTATKTLAFTTDIAAGTVTGTGLTSNQLIVGNNSSAIKTGDLTGDVTTSGSTATTLASVGTAGTYTKVTTDAKGRVTAGAQAQFSDIGGSVGGTQLSGTYTGALTFNNTGNAFTGGGAGLTNVNAVTLGGIASSAFAQLATNNVFAGSLTATSFSGIGTNLTALSASNISAGTVADARLSTNVPLLNAANIFTNTTGNTFAGTTTLGNTAAQSGGLLLPPSQNGSNKPSFPLDMEAVNGGSATHIFRILAQDGGTPNWDFQFCATAPCVPTDTGLSIASTGIITFKAGQTFPGAGSGTVTSFSSGNLAPLFTTSVVTATTTPTLSFSLTSQPANSVFASPNGAAGAPTFRSLVSTDIPNIAESQVTNLTTDLAAKAPLASPAFTGTPTAPTPATADNSTRIATTAYVQGQGYLSSAVTSFNGQAGAVNGVSSVAAAATNPGVTIGGSAANPTVAMTTAQQTRNICYVAGSEATGSPTLDASYSQKNFFYNLIGAMTPIKLACQTNAGTATVQVNKNGGSGNLSNTLSCSSTWSNTGTFVSSPTIALNEVLDFALTIPSGATRVTVCLAATVN